MSSPKLMATSVALILIISSVDCITFEEDVTLTLQQKDALDKFRQRVFQWLPDEKMKTDFYLLRWLKARKFNIDAAEEFLVENLKWRKEHRIDEAENEDWWDMEEIVPFSFDPHDNLGRPILYIEIVDLDLRGVIALGKKERLQRYLEQGIDKSCRYVYDQGVKYQNVTRGHLIINIEGFSITQHACLRCISFILDIITQYERHFPMCVDKILLMNTPSALEPLLTVIKGTMSPELRRSLKVFGTNKKAYREKLKEEFNFDTFLPQIGGTKIDSRMGNYYADGPFILRA